MWLLGGIEEPLQVHDHEFKVRPVSMIVCFSLSCSVVQGEWTVGFNQDHDWLSDLSGAVRGRGAEGMSTE